MPKQKSVNKKKVVSKSGSRKISTPLGILIVLVVGGILAVLGTLGYAKYKERDLQAKAASGALIYNANGIQMRACRLFYPPASVHSVRITATKPSGSRGLHKLTVGSYGSSSTKNPYAYAQPATTWWGNVVTATTVPIRENGWYQARVSSNGAFIATSPFVPFSYTPNC